MRRRAILAIILVVVLAAAGAIWWWLHRGEIATGTLTARAEAGAVGALLVDLETLDADLRQALMQA
jgi:multidrug resistance efflux pump